MKIFEQIEGTEFDWFASDQEGSFAIFATSGTGLVPEMVMQASEAHSAVGDSIDVKGWGSEQVWNSYASRGLYVYDCERPSGPYVKIRSPSSELETDLRSLLRRLASAPILQVSFAHSASIGPMLPNQAFKPTGHKKPWPAA